METRKHNKQFLAQNFLRSPLLARRLVAASSIGSDDIVYEIGPGRGIITTELARVAGHVVAIEKDPRLARFLRERFYRCRNIEIVESDFLDYSMPVRKYKIFASIPYSITAQIVRKIVFGSSCPQEAYLIMQKEPAKKFSGQPHETLVSLEAKPFFKLDIVALLRRTDFFPVPNVDSVLLHIVRRPVPLITSEDGKLYRDFVRYGFGRWRPHLRSALKNVFTYRQWNRLSRDLGFKAESTPTDLTLEQWIGLFEGFKSFGKTKHLNRET